MDKPPKIVVKRSFFGKGNCFKYLLYADGVVFFHFGVEKGQEWQWKKVKMNDVELGEVLLVLEGRRAEASFYHSYGEGAEKQSTSIRVNTKDDSKGKALFIGVKELNKSFTPGEQRVLEALIQHSLVRASLQL